MLGHFCDVETLWAEAGEREPAIVELADELPCDLPLEERIESLCFSRARVLHVAAGAPTWELLRHDRRLTLEQATEQVRRTVRRLVPATGGPM